MTISKNTIILIEYIHGRKYSYDFLSNTFIAEINGIRFSKIFKNREELIKFMTLQREEQE